MDFLTLRADATNAEKLAEESDETYEFLTTMLEEEEPHALKYFDKQWRRTKEHWMMLYRGEGDSTNNIAESHFHQLKQTFFLGKKNERIDDIVITLITVVIPNAIIKVQVANVLNEDRAVRILTRAGNQIVEQRASKHDECLKLIQHILEIVESRRIEPNVLIPSLKAILNLAQRSLKEE
ncbi:MULE transposase domain-containing protein [Trichomonas vaginalis G3]|uniref:MULE transposase domain-containing protein n=1 Tax=Trichomonas vaginalis (strain ATCC PRA-98 / G3) TaxID=412133 RepID=UPI0021E62415|nr:MULE transposase domain-containing protein [Trichomonas vaginalis G3]KAI5514686.1 MULE transposase domain-containing protein [Trichomonas vaginalis G3]